MKKFKSVRTIMLFLVLAAFTLVSCGDDGGGGHQAPTAPRDDIGGEGIDDEPAEAVRLRDNVPDADFGGHQFHIIVSVNGEIALLNDFEAEELMGEPINDAIYIRNSIVEERFNIEITNLEMPAADTMQRSEAQRRIRNSVAAGDNTFDAAMIAGYGTAALSQQGYLMDMAALEPIDLSMPWWDQMANQDLRILDRMFFTTGAISNVVNRATYAILFNKQMVQDFALDCPYELVRAGEWTFDKMIEMATAVTMDLDGDGTIGFDDRVGALVWDDTMMGIVNAIGERAAVVNAQGEIELTLNTERTLQVFNTFMDFVLSDAALTYQRTDWASIQADAMFGNAQALFFMQIMELVTRLRAMDIDFGVLPQAKLDTNQQNYYSTVGAWHSGFICIPIGQADPFRTASIIEAMAAESMYTLLPAYYEIALVGQLIRDEESEEMLDIIFSTRVFDVGWLFEIGGYNESIMNQLRNSRREFMSMYERGRGLADRHIERINTAFAEIFH